MRTKLSRLPILNSLMALVFSLAPAENHCYAFEAITAYAEEFPPYNFSADGKPVGIATEMLQDVCRAAAISCKIEIVPWARAYRSALITPNTLVFSTSRTPERETAFIWMGPIQNRRVWLYARSDSSLHIDSVADLSGLKIGVVNGDSAIEELKLAGVRKQNLDPAPSVESNLRKLLAGRIDIMPAVDLGMAWSLRQMNQDFHAVRPVLSYPAYDLYYAINRNSDPETVDALQKAWIRIMAEQWRESLIQRYVSGDWASLSSVASSR